MAREHVSAGQGDLGYLMIDLNGMRGHLGGRRGDVDNSGAKPNERVNGRCQSVLQRIQMQVDALLSLV
jgi:hypothetical protein